MALAQYRRAIGVFANSVDLEGALAELRDSEFPIAQISVIASDKKYVENNAQEGANTGAVAGGTLGGLAGLIAGVGAAAAVPGLGPIVLLGAAAVALTTTIAGGVTGATAGGLLGGLIGYGIPKEKAEVYQNYLHRGESIMMIEGSEADIRQAEAALSRWRVQELQIFDTPVSASRVEDGLHPI